MTSMSDHSLPEDLSLWPRDPYALFGVRRGIDSKNLRRVYGQLVRLFKPEHRPQHFQRIRQAYEILLRDAEIVGAMSLGSAEAAADGAEPKWSARPPDSDEADGLWKQAIAGDVELAYKGYRRLCEQRPTRAELYLRLYWLLVAAPEIDGNCDRRDWLVEGLRACGQPVFLELYQRELAAQPQEALRARCRRLVAQPMPGPAFLAILRSRWDEAALHGAWQVIGDDLETMRPQVIHGDAEAWLRLLLTALDYLAWDEAASEGGVLMKKYRSELEQQHLPVHCLKYELDRLDLLLLLAPAWRALLRAPSVPAHLTQLIRFSWGRPFADARPRLLELLQQISRNPRAWLEALSRAQQLGARALVQFEALLDQEAAWAAPGTLKRQPPDHSYVLRFLRSRWDPLYTVFRERLLIFCVHEMVAPDDVAGGASGYRIARGPFKEHEDLAEVIRRDLALHLVCKACRVFRG